MSEKNKPCAQCPWRLSNQGKKHKFGFYTKTNLRRLWGQIRRGGGEQSCHLTDPSHPDHVAVGAKPGATTKECPGSVIIVLREIRKMAGPDGRIEDPKPYFRANPHGITKDGARYWLLTRMLWASKRIIGGPPLPEVDEDDPEIGRPEWCT